MKRKYYMRGLGIGILVTALILGISSGQKRSMTDEEIKARAKELGMVESTVLSNLPEQTKPAETTEQTEPVEETKPVKTTEPTEPVEETKPAKTAEQTEPVETTEPVSPTEPTEPAETQPTETVSIVIRSGESSVSVSKSLEEAGLVTDASDYDRFLCENGYDKKIRTGNYEIPVGASEETIALMITGGKR